jgi:hypothetical protein
LDELFSFRVKYMDQYDSDSSGLEDAGDYTETGVLLGFPSKEPTDDTISHLGGWPVSLFPIIFCPSLTSQLTYVILRLG